MSDPCSQHHRIGTIEKNMDGLMEKLQAMESKFDGKLDLILMQINKIAVLEANHQNHSSALGRAFEKIEALEGENRKLCDFKNHAEGMARMAWLLWGTIGLGTLSLVFKVFIMANGSSV